MIPSRNLEKTFSAVEVVPPTRNDYHVAIVGYGPCGAIAAHMLGALGLRTLVVDREHDVYDKPRAIAIDHEIVRILDNMGLLDSLRAYIAPFAMSRHMGSQGQLIRTLAMVPEPYPLGYIPTMVFSQPPFEATIRQAVGRLPSVDVELGRSVVDVDQFDGGVAVRMLSATGADHTVTADYVIGCDGASSAVRRLMGIALEDLEFDEPWIVVDLLVNPGGGANLPQTSAHFCEPDRPIAYINGPGNHKRWEIMLNEDEDPAVMQKPERVWELLNRWITPDEAQLWRAASYRFHALVARDWRRGRIFLAGDSAHQQPPILGQGMCQGVRDVANLVWKLDSVIKERAPDSFLDSYALERRGHARELISRIKEIGQVLCERDPHAAQERDTRLLAEGGGTPKVITRQSVIPKLEVGVLAQGGGTGTIFPQPWIESGTGRTLMDKVHGSGWRLFVAQNEHLSPSAAAFGSELGLRMIMATSHVDKPVPEGCHRLVELEGVLAQWFNAQNAIYAIVRPDHYVFGSARTAENLSDILSQLKLHLAGTPAVVPELIGEQI